MVGFVLSTQKNFSIIFMERLLLQDNSEQCKARIRASDVFRNKQSHHFTSSVRFKNCFKRDSDCTPKLLEIINLVKRPVYFGQENKIWITLNVTSVGDFAYGLVFHLQVSLTCSNLRLPTYFSATEFVKIGIFSWQHSKGRINLYDC